MLFSIVSLILTYKHLNKIKHLKTTQNQIKKAKFYIFLAWSLAILEAILVKIQWKHSKNKILLSLFPIVYLICVKSNKKLEDNNSDYFSPASEIVSKEYIPYSHA